MGVGMVVPGVGWSAPRPEGGGGLVGLGRPSTSPTIVTSTTIGRAICFLQLRNRGANIELKNAEPYMHTQRIIDLKQMSPTIKD